MPTLEVCRTLIDYNYALCDRTQLSDEQFVQEIDYSHGSIRNQMVHVAVVDARWVRGLQGDPDARTYTVDPADYPTRAAVRELWDASVHEVKAYVATLDDDALSRTPPGMGGPVWQVLVHLANHGTDHRAQILRALHDFGAPTFDQDLILHLWAH